MAGELDGDHVSRIVRHIEAAEKKMLTLKGSPVELSGGRSRATYKIDTNHGEYVVSVTMPGAGQSGEARAAHEQTRKLHEHLYNNGVPVARPVGEVLELSSGIRCEVNEFIKGRDMVLTPPTAEDMKAFGESLAKLHAASAEYFRKHGIDPNHAGAGWRVGGDLLRIADDAEKVAVKKWLQDAEPISQSLKNATKSLRDAAYDMPGKSFVAGLTHGDAHTGNVLMKDGRCFILDLESCRRGVPLEDLSTAMLNGCVKIEEGFKVTMDEAKVKALFEGYERIRPLTNEARQGVLDMMKILPDAIVARAEKLGKGELMPAFEQLGKGVASWVEAVAKHGGNWLKRM